MPHVEISKHANRGKRLDPRDPAADAAATMANAAAAHAVAFERESAVNASDTLTWSVVNVFRSVANFVRLAVSEE
jgi:hypothetical protein